MKTDRQKTRWWVDVALFVGFMVTFFLDLTGLELHQLIGIAAGAIAAYHLLTHSSWVQSVTHVFFTKASQLSRLYYLIDAGLLLGFGAIIWTGVVMSTWLNLDLANYSAWRDAHVAASVLTLFALVAKIGLHWRWIALIARRPLLLPAAAGAAARSTAVTASAKLIGRRDFLRLTGLVGAVSCLAFTRALEDFQIGEAEAVALNTTSTTAQSEAATSMATTEPADAITSTETSATTVESTATSSATTAPTATATVEPTQTTSLFASSQSSTTSSCTVRCRKACAGRGCRKYTDTDGSGRCDYGECA